MPPSFKKRVFHLLTPKLLILQARNSVQVDKNNLLVCRMLRDETPRHFVSRFIRGPDEVSGREEWMRSARKDMGSPTPESSVVGSSVAESTVAESTGPAGRGRVAPAGDEPAEHEDRK